MSKKKKPKIEYRYYEMPAGSPVLALLGESWIRNYGDGGTIDYLHFHNHLEVGVCHWGKGVLLLEDEELEFGANMFSLIPRNFPHTTNAEGLSLSSWEYLFIDVDKFLAEVYRDHPEVADRMIQSVNKKAHFCHMAEKPEIVVLIRQIIEVMRARKELYLEEVKGLVLALLIQIVRWNRIEESEQQIPEGKSTVVEPALEFISKHFDCEIRIEELAELCHISETHFRRIFRESMGKTPMEYVNWVRIKNACNQLKRTNDPVSTIAVRTGFSTLSTFNRNFKRVIGTSPQEWRKNPEHYEHKLLNYNVKRYEGW